MMRWLRYMGVLVASLAVLLAGSSGFAAQSGPGGSQMRQVRIGFNSAIDQIAVPAAVDQGFYEAHGLDAKLAPPFASGVDALNALQAGTVDFVHVGAPLMGALLSGMDVVYIGNYTGTAAKVRADDTFSMVARQGSGIDPKNLATLKGKKIASTLGSTNHLWVINILASKGITPDQVTLINTAPPDMPVALQTGGVDAVVCWDPWPVIAKRTVAGTYEVMRGGGYVANVGFMVTRREFADKNPDVVTRFLLARAEADMWVRKNPDETVQIATRWIPGTNVEVARESMNVVKNLLDPRISACNLVAMQEEMDFTIQVKGTKPTAGFNVLNNVRPEFILEVIKKRPDLVAGLAPIPQAAVLASNSPTAWKSWNRDAAAKACKN